VAANVTSRARFKDRGVREIVAGVLTLAALGGLFAFSYTVDSRVRHGYSLDASFTSVDGISENSPVWLSGVKVGTVSKMRLDPEFMQAILTLRINKGVKLPEDSSVAVVSQGLLGGKYLMISPGGSPDMMKDGDSFQYVQNSVIIENLLQQIVQMAERRAAERKTAGKDAGVVPAPAEQPKK
jgi:phospholipid/cholesterol/gamma-HCH transport system substrate-binding protein